MKGENKMTISDFYVFKNGFLLNTPPAPAPPAQKTVVPPSPRLAPAPAPPALPEDIIKLIDDCKITQQLNLSNHNLNNSDVEEILKYVTERNIKVTTLDLGNNHLTTLPESIGQLKSLKLLNLCNNQLAALPESIGQLESLEKLYLGINQLATLPESIGQLKSLQDLHLNNNQLATLPESIGLLECLRSLYLGYNQLSTLPESIGNLEYLEALYLEINQLATLPESIGLLKSLKYLYLSTNKLTALPKSIGLLKSLRFLYLVENHLTTLPESIGQLPILKYLYLKRNYLTIPPIQLQVGITVPIEDQKNKEILIDDFQKAQKKKQIIHDKMRYYTENPLGQLTLEETFNHAIINSLDQSGNTITIKNKPMHSLTSYLKTLEKYHYELPSINRQIDHLKNIASERNWEIPDSVVEVAT